MEVTVLKRVFVYDGKKLNDPNPEMTVEEVMDFYSNVHPELNNSTFIEQVKDDSIHYEFKSIAGSKA